jgi:predicted transcriptional regulator
MIKILLRSYGGILNDLVYFKENELAERLQLDIQTLKQKLSYLHKLGIVHYAAAASKPELYFTVARQHPDRIGISQKNYRQLADAA